MRTILLLLSAICPAVAEKPAQSYSHPEAEVRWRENECAGYGPGDCSVRQPQTAWVRVQFKDRDVRILVRCKTQGCRATPEEIDEWVQRAKEAK